MLRSRCRRWLLAITVLMSAGSDQAQQQQILPGISTQVTCTDWGDLPSGVQFCARVGYGKAATPNFRIPPQNVPDASKEINDYQPIISTRCSGALIHFLCSFYFPPCYNDPALLQTHVLGPCYSMCDLVRRECASTFMLFGVPYPPFLNCSLPPFNPTDGVCFGPSDPTTLTYPVTGGSGISNGTTVPSLQITPATPGTTAQQLYTPSVLSTPLPLGLATPTFTTTTTIALPTPQSSTPVLPYATSYAPQPSVMPPQATGAPSVTPAVEKPTCYGLPDVPFCANVNNAGYKSTGIYLPNLLGDTTPQKAQDRLDSYTLFVDIKCSHALVPFLCSYYAPSCLPSPPYMLQPCSDLCEFVRKGCEPAFVGIGMTWPMQFACEDFPDANDTACYGLASLGTPTSPTLSSSYATREVCCGYIAALAVSVSLLAHFFLSQTV